MTETPKYLAGFSGLALFLMWGFFSIGYIANGLTPEIIRTSEVCIGFTFPLVIITIISLLIVAGEFR